MTEDLRVVHFMDAYPLFPQHYIHGQIVTSGGRRDRAVAAFCSRSGSKSVKALLGIVPDALWSGVRIHRLMNALLNRTFGGCSSLLVSRLQRDLEREPADLVHAHFGMAGARIANLALFVDTPLVTTFYGVDASACLRNPAWLARYKPLFAHGRLFITLSETVRERLIRFGCPAEKTIVWDIGLETETFPNHNRIPGPRPRFLCVARFVEKKGHDTLIEAFSIVVKEMPAELTLIGYGHLLPEIQRSLAAHALRDSVKVVDTSGTTDFWQIFRGSLDSHDIFVLPCKTARDGDDEAGPPLTLVAAQLAGMPVISTPFVGHERTLRDGETAILCSPESPAELAVAMLQLARDKARALAIGARGREIARARFSREAQLRALTRHYEAALRDEAGDLAKVHQ